MLKKILFLLLLFTPVSVFAYGLINVDTTKVYHKKTHIKPATSEAEGHQLSLQAEAGSQGAGFDVRYGVYKQLSLRLGGNFVPFKHNYDFKFSDFKASSNVYINFYNVHLLADYVPFKNLRGLRLVGGGAYLYQARGGANLVPTSGYNYGDIPITPDQIGDLSLDVSWKGIAPYVGIGLFKSFPKRTFNINIDIGTYYLNRPNTTITGTKLLAGNVTQQPIVNNNLSDYRFLPVIQLNFNFNLYTLKYKNQ